ncbi:hypothetical protein NYR55_09170 [Sphingomonas sp. BGYR3]|uniref:hypothetical protein n=1 Tax=Sphingomonas sp. BGYR3 TaxID=2975483 RepID=UPI0021A9676D|nr:hypothetical protein [Sphingomonas sp. BGYR3]MDG5488787.1 hypothetical protein [Sphingomonas sp. BGYR3]
MQKFSPEWILRRHLQIILILVAAHIVVGIFAAMGRAGLLGMSRLFRLSGEANFPSLFSAAALCASGVVAGAVARRTEGHARLGWNLISVFFLILAVDEGVSLHEQLNRVEAYLDPRLSFKLLGVSLYLLAGLTLAWYLFGWWRTLPRPLGQRLLGAALLYAVSAAGVEVIEIQILPNAGLDEFSWPATLLFAIEEGGEMVAGALFLHIFLTRFVQLGGGTIGVSIVASDHSPEREHGKVEGVTRFS